MRGVRSSENFAMLRRPTCAVLIALALAASSVLAVEDGADETDLDPDCFANRETESWSETEYGGEEEPGEEPPRKKAKRKQGWSCAPHQKEFIEQCRRRFDANPRGVCESGWVVSPPLVRGFSNDPRRESLHPWGAWVVESIFSGVIRAPFCPGCSKNDMIDVAHAKWKAEGPRVVLGGPSVVWYLDSKRYTCGRGCPPFLGTNPVSIGLLPPNIFLNFQVRLNRRSSVDSALSARSVSRALGRTSSL